MSRNRPLISVAMPFRNAEATIAASVKSILWQDCDSWELILVDDGSTDCSLEIVRSFTDRRISVLSDGRHVGLPTRLNQCVAEANGLYVARMDADDVAYPNRLGEQSRLLTSRPELDLIGTAMVVFDNTGRPLGRRAALDSHEDICSRPQGGIKMAHPTWMGKHSWFASNPYNATLMRSQDRELLLRTYAKSRFANIPAILQGYREVLSWQRSLRNRNSWARQAIVDGAANGRLGSGLLAAATSYLKGLLDMVAVSSGLGYSLLRHRAGALSSDETAQWVTLWNRLRAYQIVREAS